MMLLGVLISPTDASALPVETYAASSRLGTGKWVKVNVEKTGIQFISTANLRKMGFSDPSKVRVYGFGGRVLSTNFSQTTTDDLPLVASHCTSKGIHFFGYDHIRRTYSSNRTGTKFFNTMQPYAEESWYFLSDSDPDPAALPAAPHLSEDFLLNNIDSYTCNLLYERDFYHPSNTGANYLGEDFRSPTKRSFDFSLTDIVEGSDAYAKIAFANNATGAS